MATTMVGNSYENEIRVCVWEIKCKLLHFSCSFVGVRPFLQFFTFLSAKVVLNRCNVAVLNNLKVIIHFCLTT